QPKKPAPKWDAPVQSLRLPKIRTPHQARIRGNCNLKFYDLHKSPIVCPICKTAFEPPRRYPQPWEAPTAPLQQPVRAQAPAVIIREGGTLALGERDEEGAAIDEDFENE